MINSTNALYLALAGAFLFLLGFTMSDAKANTVSPVGATLIMLGLLMCMPMIAVALWPWLTS